MSEFGYIMELLAKGKVSASAVGLRPRSRPGTHDLRVGCGIGAVPCLGDTAWNPGLRSHQRIPLVHNALCPPFLYVEERVLFELVRRQRCRSPAGENGDFRAARQLGDLEWLTGAGSRGRVLPSVDSEARRRLCLLAACRCVGQGQPSALVPSRCPRRETCRADLWW